MKEESKAYKMLKLDFFNEIKNLKTTPKMAHFGYINGRGTQILKKLKQISNI